MADLAASTPLRRERPAKDMVLWSLLITALALCAAKPILPDFLIRLPEAWIPPTADILDRFFDFIKGDREEGRFGLIYITRWFAEGPLEFMLGLTANLLEGKHRWPFIGPLPWSCVAAVAAILGYYLGGWKLALLAGGTFVWTALIGQWELAMQTLSVLAVAAPLAFVIGLGLGIMAW
ncbi:MAG: glycine/betaine ABC transporter permease, partial [Pseudomonadota bacterium]